MRITLPMFACSVAAAAAAQAPLPTPTRGMLSTLQLGVVFDDDRNVIARKEPGLPAKLEDFEGLGRARVPEYTTAAIETWVSTRFGWCPTLEIDAMSTANDLLPLAFRYAAGDQQAFQITQGNGLDWAALFLSRTSSANDGAEIIGYYFRNPGFPLPLRNTVYTEILRSEFLSGSVLSPAVTNANIAALDAGMGIIETSGGALEPGVIEHFNELYFSLTPDNAGDLAATYVFGNPAPTCTGATIFRATYSAVTGEVIGVDVFLQANDLDLGSQADVDALAIAFVRGPLASVSPPLYPVAVGSPLVLFSTTSAGSPGDAPEELMVYATPVGAPQVTGPVVRPLRKENGDPLLGPSGTLSGNVKGVCAHDPEVGAAASSFGIPIRTTRDPDLGLSLHARTAPSPSGQEDTDSFRLTGVVSGWGVGGVPHYAVTLLVVERPGYSDTFYALPMRTPADGTLEFAVDIEFPWENVGVLRNEYEMYVVTCSVPISDASVVRYSVVEKFRREP